MHKFLSAITATAITVLSFSSCSTSDIEGYEKTKDGLYYKFHKHAENQPHPKQDDELHMKFVLKIYSNDSVLTDSRKVREDGVVTMLMRPESFKGSLESALTMMSQGDSASFIINADSFFLKTSGMKQLPPFIKPGDKLKADIKLEKFVDAKIVEEENKKREAEQMKMFQELEMKSKADIEKYIADNSIKAQPTASGLYYVEMKKGNGPKVMPGDTVQVYYRGLLMDGTVFNDNTKDPQPIEFPVGVGALIPGWDEGIPMMNVGGKAKLIVPYSLAYGPSGRPPQIPQFANLVFEIEVKGVKKGAK